MAARPSWVVAAVWLCLLYGLYLESPTARRLLLTWDLLVLGAIGLSSAAFGAWGIAIFEVLLALQVLGLTSQEIWSQLR